MFFLKPKCEVVIGRAPTAGLRLTDSATSGRHCVVRSAGDMLFVEDLCSRNGTRINGEAITTRVLDEDGRVELGTSVIELTWVTTESEVPLGAVTSPAAPTLLDDPGNTSRMPRVEGLAGSTIVGQQQLQELRRAQGLLGSTVGGNMLLEVFGVGSMGFVYRAKDMKAREELALKLIPKASARTTKLLDKFLGECRLNLGVPGAARLLSVGQDGEYAYITMEIVKGRGLQSLVDAGRKFSPADAAAIVLPVCGTLHVAHTQGIVHRDLKPANIVVPETGAPILLDLGAGKKTDSEGRGIVDRGDRLESVAFASPEFTREVRTLDGRADVYSMAATLSFVLTGQRLFTAASQIELVRKIRWECAPLVTTLRPDVPAAFAAVIARALEKEAEGRYTTMLEFAEALQAAVS
jgi:serine/threonine-protein kinase